MNEHEKSGISYLTHEILARSPGVFCAVSMRHGGVSAGVYSTLNLALHVGDEDENVLENRKRLCRALGIEPSALVFAEQVHGSRVAVVTGSDRGSGLLSRDDSVPEADALVTDSPGTALVVLVADCVVVSLYDPARRVAGIAHASWRGTLDGIALETVLAMERSFGSRGRDIVAGLSPSIGPCCYEVGEEVAGRFREKRPRHAERILAGGRGLLGDRTAAGRPAGGSKSPRGGPPAGIHLDLWEANRLQLLEAGLPGSNIEIAGICTSCNTDRFYSYRREKGKTGRFCGLVMLR